ncbi:MAG: peptidoglycan DD-metalloendopeptidase family protein [Desulfuromonadaceae bacterium]|nr:peptidoglycan DD-metalloendopeptidase family protein [Desulfuromonadaceae bacterium]
MTPHHHNRYRPTRSTHQRRRQNTLLFLVLASIGLVVFFATRQDSVPSATPKAEIPRPATFQEPPPSAIIQIQRETICEAVQPGQTITAILGSYFSPSEILTIAQQSKPVFPLSQLCAGHPYRIEIENENFVSFYYDIDKDDQLLIRKEGDTFLIERQPIPYTVEVETIAATIDSSLFGSVAAIGESSELAARLMDIFAWDIDFIRDIREGDYFVALVEKRYRDGNLAGYGDLLAAEFSNQGRSYFAIYFNDGSTSSYFDEQGKSLRKAFLKAPLSYTRISSGYTKRRFHPVLNKWKPHLAIDYAAPTGTPIRAVADGTITQKSYDKSNGNKIRIRHPNSYETTYIHMSKFAKGMKKGRHVSQGEVIGYVGMTGIATGPHLDFRVFKNGQPINPLKMESTPAAPVTSARQAEFDQLIGRLQHDLSLGRQKLLNQTALNPPAPQQASTTL